MSKKVLIVSYYWPPSGGIGVLRSLKLAKYLHHFGWEPIIFTAEGAAYPTHDTGNFKDVDEKWTVIKQKIWEPYSLFKMFTGRKKQTDVSNYLYVNQSEPTWKDRLSVWIRSNYFIPDARAFWINPSIEKISKFLETETVDAIFSCGPPHSNTLIASRVSKKFGIPHLLDFQDPWTQVDYFQKLSLSKSSLQKHLDQEQEVLKQASAISIVSEQWAQDLASLTRKSATVIPWGFDPDDYADLNPRASEDFEIIHTGLIGEDRNPVTFLKAITQLAKENPIFAAKTKVKFFGLIDQKVKETIADLDTYNLVEVVPPIDRAELLKKMCGASVLLLLLNKQENASGRIPGKLFEYLALKKNILALGKKRGDSSQIVEESKAGKYFDYESELELRNYLSDAFTNFEKTSAPPIVESNIEQYSNYKTTQAFAKILDQVSEATKIV